MALSGLVRLFSYLLSACLGGEREEDLTDHTPADGR
jgi:hypothetical protein